MARMRMRQAVVAALADEMRIDDTVMLLGEDVAAAGGPFKTSEGLLDEFGPLRVRDTPISEMGFTGAALGAAVMGMKPVVEIMFVEFLGVALDQLVTEAAKFRYLSGGQLSAPLTVRASVGSGLGFGCQHSQTLENWFTATPGLKVVVPSDAQTAYGLLRAAIRDPDPTLVLEPRALYGERGQVATGDSQILPIGQARVARAGKDCTVVTLGQTTGIVRAAAQQSGLELEIIDLLTIVPWDREAVLKSVRKTGRLVVVEEAPQSGGWGHEIVSTVVSTCFPELRAAPFRVCAPDVPVPYAKSLEAHYLPTADDVAQQLTGYLDNGLVPPPWWVREGLDAR